MNTTPDFSCDVLIIGSGAAGLSLALRLAEHSSVTVLSKGPISEGFDVLRPGWDCRRLR